MSSPVVIPARRRWLFRCSAFLITAVLGLIAIEIVARVMHLGGDRGVLVPHPVFHHWHLESYEADFWSSRGDWGGHRLRYNADGFMMADELPPAGVSSVVVLGDSFVEAKQVPEDRRFVTHLGEHLGMPALNFGCGSFSPLLSRIQLEYFEDRISPRAVVLVLFWNDLQDERYYQKLAVRDASGRAIRVSGEGESNRFGRFLRRSHAYRFASHVYRSQKRHGQRPPAEGISRPAFEKPIEDTFRAITLSQFRRSLGEIRAWCAERSAPLLLTVVPEEGALAAGEPDHFGLWSQRIAAELEIPFLDLRPHLASHPTSKLYFPDDRHFTPFAHEIVGKSIATRLAAMIR